MKRRAMQIIILLFFGAIVNVAVAWSCLLLLEPSKEEVSYSWTRVPLEHDARGYVRSSWEIGVYTMNTRTLVQGFGLNIVSYEQSRPSFYDELPELKSIVPTWVIDQIDPIISERPVLPKTIGMALMCEALGTGWPMQSCCCVTNLDYSEFSETGNSTLTVHSAIQLDLESPSQFKLLPYRPIWPGFALNTLFYTLILALFWFTPITLRRWRRVRTGRCPNCAYDLQHEATAGCPECGWNRAEHPTS